MKKAYEIKVRRLDTMHIEGEDITENDAKRLAYDAFGGKANEVELVKFEEIPVQQPPAPADPFTGIPDPEPAPVPAPAPAPEPEHEAKPKKK